MWIDTNGVANNDGIMELPGSANAEFNWANGKWQLRHSTMDCMSMDFIANPTFECQYDTTYTDIPLAD